MKQLKLAKHFAKTSALFWLCAIWSVSVLGMCVMEFLKFDAFTTPRSLPFIYAVLIFTYFCRKEIDRWLGKFWKKRQGEYFFVAWWCTLLIMYVLVFLFPQKFILPRKMLETCLAMTLPFLLTEISKKLHACRHALKSLFHKPKCRSHRLT
ncbi:hypothetical protein C4546_00305 [Candidatus Parcubacteria bacterium]|jgi:hypothetical protein|nr:MAG: hypothetical protein C4546_00305 [Candidatus Parcubacteria bacterium]